MKLISFYIALFCLVLSAPLQADYPTFHFKMKDFPLGHRKYVRYARPQLKSMVREFYHIISKFSPTLEKIVEGRKKYKSITDFLGTFQSDCYQNQECMKKLNEAYEKIRGLNLTLLELKKISSEEINTFTTPEDYHVHLPELMEKMIQLEDTLMNIRQSYDIETSTSYRVVSKQEKNIQKLNFSIVHLFNYTMIDALPNDLKKEFEKVWFFFFKPVEKYVIPDPTSDQLLKRAENLNMVWNTFHMKISKGEMRVPTNGHKVIITMHRRWVSILKLFLSK